jgi:hypothetical protein
MIDVAISSCGRTDILETAIRSFNEHVHTSEGLRFVICEDKVDSVPRQEKGKKWIEDNAELFDEIVYSGKKLTYVYCFTEVLRHIKSPYFFRLEDDVEFFEDIDLDEIVEYMKGADTLAQMMFRRDIHNLTGASEVDACGKRNVLQMDLYSIATGVFNLEWARKIVGYSGTGECHESGVLTPSMNELNATSNVIGGINKECALIECGNKKGYCKGGWKRE